MSSANIGWLFYKDYYNTLIQDDYRFMLLSKEEQKRRVKDKEKIEIKIQDKIKLILSQSIEVNKDEGMLGNTHFKASTTYPGLILGSGNTHELPDIKGQAILGFHFDYTSGLPVIQGSSIKGVLKSAFPLTKEELKKIFKNNKLTEIEKENIKELNEHKQEYIEEYVSCNVEKLKKEIFDNGDVFFDATIVSNGKILGDDHLAPHEDNPLKSPNVLRFIKVLPHVSFRFDFELNSGIISKSKKYDLFKSILGDLGLGAKTNVGYGKFDNFIKVQTEYEQELERKERENERFYEAIKADSLELLEAFKCDYPSTFKNIDKAIETIKHNNKAATIKNKFDKLDKSNAIHVKSFIKTYEDDVNAKEFIDKLKNIDIDDPKPANINFKKDVLSQKKYKQLDTKLKNFLEKAKRELSKDEKNELEEHLLLNMEKNLRKFPFTILNNDKVFGKEKTAEIKNKLDNK